MLFKLIFIFLVSVITIRGFHITNESYPLLRIVHGREVPIKDAPYMASLKFDVCTEVELVEEIDQCASGITYFCSAMIISPNWILTSAHCLNKIDRLSVSSQLSNIIVYTATQTAIPSEYFPSFLSRSVSEKFIHEKYPKKDKGPYLNDIALLKLAKSIKISDLEKPIPLATSKDMPQIGQNVTRLGYGDDGEEHRGRYEIPLQTTEEEVISQEECQKYYPKSDISSHFCSVNTNGGDCGGDSGGAVIINGKLVGIIAHGFHAFCKKGRKTFGPDLATRVDLYYDWIVQHVGKDELAQ